jgi:2-polyprenyl-3-methyl-5-hydroxy-6-metoxy-1,4-benzoquinol methylase
MRQTTYAERVYRHYVRSGYGRVHSFSRSEYEMQARFFRRNYAPHLPQDREARILDIGCGPGHFLYYLQQDGYTDYLGIDSSPECLQLCRERGLNAGIADAFVHLAENAARYDAIVCNEFFEHLDKERAFELADLCRLALKDNGVLLIKVPNMACPVAACRSRYVDITHEMGYVDHSLRTMLQVCGFGEVTVVAPDIYVTRNPLANVAARLLYRLVTACFRCLYLLYGIPGRHVMTKSILAVSRKLPADAA